MFDHMFDGTKEKYWKHKQRHLRGRIQYDQLDDYDEHHQPPRSKRSHYVLDEDHDEGEWDRRFKRDDRHLRLKRKLALEE
jgi:hypothetical protein